jgi:hypothetical protein
MSAVSVEQKIRTAAAANSTLLLMLRTNAQGRGPDTSAPFRWYTDGLLQGSLYPAVVTQLISNPRAYSQDGQMPTSWARVQFTIWGGPYTAGAQAREDVGQALGAFFATLDLSSRPAGLVQPNFIDLERNAAYPQKDGLLYQKVMDLMVFVDDSL